VVSSLGNESMSSGQGGCWAASEESRLTASETRIATPAFKWSSSYVMLERRCDVGV